jgi:hypothetical protein
MNGFSQFFPINCYLFNLFKIIFLQQSFLMFLFFLLSRKGKEVCDDLRGPELSAGGAGHPVQEAALLPVE